MEPPLFCRQTGLRAIHRNGQPFGRICAPLCIGRAAGQTSGQSLDRPGERGPRPAFHPPRTALGQQQYCKQNAVHLNRAEHAVIPGLAHRDCSARCTAAVVNRNPCQIIKRRAVRLQGNGGQTGQGRRRRLCPRDNTVQRIGFGYRRRFPINSGKANTAVVTEFMRTARQREQDADSGKRESFHFGSLFHKATGSRMQKTSSVFQTKTKGPRGCAALCSVPLKARLI